MTWHFIFSFIRRSVKPVPPICGKFKKYHWSYWTRSCFLLQCERLAAFQGKWKKNPYFLLGVYTCPFEFLCLRIANDTWVVLVDWRRGKLWLADVTYCALDHRDTLWQIPIFVQEIKFSSIQSLTGKFKFNVGVDFIKMIKIEFLAKTEILHRCARQWRK